MTTSLWFDIFRETCSASTFHLYDESIRQAVDTFAAAVSKSLSFGGFFVARPDGKSYRFMRFHESPTPSKVVEAHDQFERAVRETAAAFRVLLDATRKQYPEIDLYAITKAALAQLRKLDARLEETMKSARPGKRRR